MSDLMDKIGALLLKAERTDNEHERDAFLSKAQQLATLASVDLEAARLRQESKELRETPISKMIRLFPYGDKSKTKSYFLWLFVRIGNVNDLEFTLSWDSTYVTAYGYPSDIEVTEALYSSLSQQMVSECEAWLKTGEYKKETMQYEQKVKDPVWGWTSTQWVTKPVDGRTARRSFYEGFRVKVVERLREAKKVIAATAPAMEINGESVSTDVVLKSKAESVKEFYRENSNARGTYRGAAGGSSSAGRGAGAAAGARASMGSRRGVGGKTAIAG